MITKVAAGLREKTVHKISMLDDDNGKTMPIIKHGAVR
jgi:hypothetical protein